MMKRRHAFNESPNDGRSTKVFQRDRSYSSSTEESSPLPDQSSNPEHLNLEKLNALPPEVWTEIFKKTDFTTLLTWRRVSKQWNDFITPVLKKRSIVDLMVDSNAGIWCSPHKHSHHERSLVVRFLQEYRSFRDVTETATPSTFSHPFQNFSIHFFGQGSLSGFLKMKNLKDLQDLEFFTLVGLSFETLRCGHHDRDGADQSVLVSTAKMLADVEKLQVQHFKFLTENEFNSFVSLVNFLPKLKDLNFTLDSFGSSTFFRQENWETKIAEAFQGRKNLQTLVIQIKLPDVPGQRYRGEIRQKMQGLTERIQASIPQAVVSWRQTQWNSDPDDSSPDSGAGDSDGSGSSE